jgi:hypothetical protein
VNIDFKILFSLIYSLVKAPQGCFRLFKIQSYKKKLTVNCKRYVIIWLWHFREGNKETMSHLSEQTICEKRFQTGTSHIQRRATHSTMSLDGSHKIGASLPTHLFANRLQNNTLALCHTVLVLSCSLQHA